MTIKTLSHLIIAVALTGSSATGLQLGPSSASAPVSSAFPAAPEAAPSGRGLLSLLPAAADRFSATCAGLKLAPPPIVCLAP